MPYKIGVISDTHGLLRDEVKEYLQGCDRIFHAGDINNPSVIEECNRIAPTFVVRGNADKEWADALPVTNEISDIGIKVLMIHNKKHIDVDVSSYDMVIYGHSHKYEEKKTDNVTWLNPGSCGPRRFNQPVTMAMLYVEDDGSFHIEKIDIAHKMPSDTATAKAKPQKADIPEEIKPEHIKQYIPAMIRDIDKGVSVERLARKYHISYDLSEQICRLYLTHPGVDADGIMGKMGI
jgi:putative phosphoesterase